MSIMIDLFDVLQIKIQSDLNPIKLTPFFSYHYYNNRLPPQNMMCVIISTLYTIPNSLTLC
ncbi:hypothetical protein PEDI_22340 [Persicobacter diffluens]|uniref:Uncharacterized protein n=1 Tax=Persicobacter diffluens TaxID=981 RepID=A0AAN4VZQ9_9BACT|nr:hypothetical protein PEDI_22340 [Persicobacter diffluens]